MYKRQNWNIRSNQSGNTGDWWYSYLNQCSVYNTCLLYTSSMRVWMKPDVLAQYKLIPSDITGVLAEQNIESATGSFGENSNETYQYTMKYKGRLITRCV